MIKTNNNLFDKIIPEIKTDITDLLHEEDLNKLDEILSYLKCSYCSKVMLDPRMCLSCNKKLCKKCHKLNCNHALVLSRHLKSILENLKLKCKYYQNGCDDNTEFNFFTLKNHSENCLSYKQAYEQKVKEHFNENINKLKNNEINDFEENINEVNNNFTSSRISLAKFTNEDEIKNINSVECSCGEIIKNDDNLKNAFIKHKKYCLINNSEYSTIYKSIIKNNNENNDNDFNIIKESNSSVNNINNNDSNNNFNNLEIEFNSNVDVKDTLVNEFMKKIEIIQKNFYDLTNARNTEYIDKIQTTLNKFNNSIEEKKSSINDLENEINNFYKTNKVDKSNIPEKYLLKNKEYQKLINEENILKEQEAQAKKSLNKAKAEYLLKENQGEEEINNNLADYKKKLQQLKVQEIWLKEEISVYEPELVNSIFSDSDSCNKCKDNNISVKKFSCQKCFKKFCTGKCALICANSSCIKTSKYICPNCVPKCAFCRKNIYCDNCKKKCFYEGCPNTFCPECFNKNAHQARSSNNNCAFFACEIDKVKSCLMTTMFCSECEKRLCNNCLFKDKDHFDKLFK